MNDTFSIVYMGTPDFAVPPLKALAAEGYDIRLVITQPDRPKGRGRKPDAPPVKRAAQELGLPVLQVSTMKTPEVIDTLKTIGPDLFVVAAFGHILTPEVLAIPALHPINIHASLLPKYRGASPIQSAILNLETETGVTTMIMDKGMDTGDMLLKAVTPIGREETAASLHDRLADMGADLIVQTLEALKKGTLEPVPQNHDQATKAPMLKKEDGRIDWFQSPELIDARTRAMTPWPGAFTFLEGKRYKLFAVTPKPGPPQDEPGLIQACGPDGIQVSARTGKVVIRELQGASGKRLTAADFLLGHPLKPGSRFES